MSTSISFSEGDIYPRQSPEDIIDDAIINIMAGNEKYWENVKVMGVPSGIETENARTSLMKHKNQVSIKSQNDRLTKEHTDFNASKSDMQKRSLLKYQKKLENIYGERIHLFDIATTDDKSSEVTNKLKPLFLLDEIYNWISDLPKEGGRRRKCTRRRVSTLRNKKTLRNIRRRR
jgi:hypothetical protein